MMGLTVIIMAASALSMASEVANDIDSTAAQIRMDQPEVAVRVDEMRPLKNRAGQWFFPGRDLTTPAAQVLIQDRLLDAADIPGVRVALAYALDEEHRLPWSVISEQTAVVRVALLHGYKKVETSDSTAVLNRAMQDDAAEVRAEAVRLAGYQADIGVLETRLMNGLQDADLNVRMLSARTLGWHEVREAFAPVSVLLNDPSADVRVAAVRALGKLDPVQAKSMVEIQRFAEGDHPGLQRAAKRVMKP
jgi:hypothetical protein